MCRWRPGLGADFARPVLAAAAHALPVALRHVSRPAGTTVTFTAEGQGGGSWHVVRTEAGCTRLITPKPRLGRAGDICARHASRFLP